MRRYVFILMLLTAGLSRVARADFANPADCYNPSRIQNEVTPQFKVTFRDPNLQYRYCDPNNVMYQAFQALLYLKDLPQVAVATDESDQGILGNRPYDFLTSHISELSFEADGGRNCGYGTMAFVENQQPTIHICPWINNFDVLTNAGVFIHESRHVDGYPHVLCDHGPYRNSGFACDPSYQTRGSYAAGTEFEVKISRSESVNQATRLLAQGYAITDFMEHFNQLPLDIRQGLLLESSDNAVDFYDGQTRTAIIGSRPANQVFFSTSSMLAGFFNPDDLSVSYYQSRGRVIEPEKSNLEDELRFATPRSDAIDLLDVAAVGSGTCVLFPQHLHCFRLGDTASTFDVPLNGLEATSFVTIHQSIIFNEGDVYLATDAGALYLLPTFESLLKSDPSRYPRAPGSLDVLSIAQVGSGRELLLRSNHLLQLYDSNARIWKRVPGFETSWIKKMVGPYYWSPMLDQI